MIKKYLGMSKKDAIKRLPSYIRGAILQTIYSHQEVNQYNMVAGRPDVMLVPGLFCSPSVFNRLGQELENKFNIHTPRSFPYWFSVLSNTGPIEKSALELVKDINDLAEQGVKQLSLVGHSLGGVIVLYALERYCKKQIHCEIDQVILLGAPVNGSPITKLLGFIPACKDLQPKSKIINKLNCEMADCIVVSGFDSIVPYTYQIPFPSTNNFFDGNIITFPDFQHMDFYAGEKKKIKKIANLLTRHLKGDN